MKSGTTRALFPAAVLAAALLGACAGMEPGAAYVAPPAGSTWSTLQRNTGSFGSGEVQVNTTAGEQVFEGRQLLSFRNAQGTMLAEPASGRWVVALSPDGRPATRFDPPLGFEWPITVGREMKNNYRMTNAAGGAIAVQTQCRVEDYGDVAVRAGTFKAFRVACSNSIGQSDTMWYAPDLGIFVKTSAQRTAAYPAGAGSREAEVVAVNIKR